MKMKMCIRDSLLVAGDDFFQQDVFPVVAEQVFRIADRKRFGWVQAGHHARQPSRALRPGVAGVRLADGLAETHGDSLAIERVHEAESDGGQPDPLLGGDDKNGGGHGGSLGLIYAAMQYRIHLLTLKRYKNY